LPTDDIDGYNSNIGRRKPDNCAQLTIHSTCTLDPDIVVLTFVIVEKKRRDAFERIHGRENEKDYAECEEPCEAGIEAGTM
jgi:hypothetical protein